MLCTYLLNHLRKSYYKSWIQSCNRACLIYNRLGMKLVLLQLWKYLPLWLKIPSAKNQDENTWFLWRQLFLTRMGVFYSASAPTRNDILGASWSTTLNMEDLPDMLQTEKGLIEQVKKFA